MEHEKIVYLDCHIVNPGDLSWGSLADFPGLVCYDRTRPEEVVDRVGDARVVIVNKVRLTDEVFAQLPCLRLVCVSSTGYDVVDVEAARRRGIVVCNCAGYSTESVAQMVMAHLLAVTNAVESYSRQVCKENAWCNSKDFCYWTEPIRELHGMRVAVVGYGNIGQAVCNRLRPFGVEMYAVTSKNAAELPTDVRKISVDEAFASCDVVSLNCPLTAQNAGFVNRKLLSGSKPGLILINMARGGLIVEQDVADALHEGRLGAYCCDVLAHEPALSNNPLLQSPRVYITPHIAWASPGARRRIIEILAQNIRNFLNGCPSNVVG